MPGYLVSNAYRGILWADVVAHISLLFFMMINRLIIATFARLLSSRHTVTRRCLSANQSHSVTNAVQRRSCWGLGEMRDLEIWISEGDTTLFNVHTKVLVTLERRPLAMTGLHTRVLLTGFHWLLCPVVTHAAPSFMFLPSHSNSLPKGRFSLMIETVM